MSAARPLSERLPLIADLWDEMGKELGRGGSIYRGDVSRDDTQALRDAAALLADLLAAVEAYLAATGGAQANPEAAQEAWRGMQVAAAKARGADHA